jgi:hypothetical protein
LAEECFLLLAECTFLAAFGILYVSHCNYNSLKIGFFYQILSLVYPDSMSVCVSVLGVGSGVRAAEKLGAINDKTDDRTMGTKKMMSHTSLSAFKSRSAAVSSLFLFGIV